MIAAPDTLLFDLDGTLTDSRPGIVACIRHALMRMGAVAPDDDTVEAPADLA